MHNVQETERLLLRQFTPDDVELLVELDSDPEVMRFLTGGTPTPRGVIQADILPAFLRSYRHGDGFGIWAVLEKSSGDFLGWLAFHPCNESNSDVVSLGYRLRRSAWGQGYATEGARALICNGFTQLGVQRVVATTYEYNLASRRVMEKVGMRLVRSFRLTTADLLAETTVQQNPLDVWEGNEVEYALEKRLWEQNNKNPVVQPIS